MSSTLFLPGTPEPHGHYFTLGWCYLPAEKLKNPLQATLHHLYPHYFWGMTHSEFSLPHISKYSGSMTDRHLLFFVPQIIKSYLLLIILVLRGNLTFLTVALVATSSG